MAKTKKQSPKTEGISDYQKRLNYEATLDRINGELLKMRYNDLQKACIIRGMEPNLMVSCDIGGLQTWIIKNWEAPQDEQRLHDFDSWRAAFLKGIGKEGEPFARLGYMGETNEETGDIDIIKPKKLRKSDDKRERDTDMGIFKGTKKALTFQCVKEGKTVEETIEIVTKQFPDAKDKSIKIWRKRCLSKINAKD